MTDRKLKIAASLLLRDPVTPAAVHREWVEEIWSPDENQVVATSHEIEPRNGFFFCLFSLLDRQEKILDRFEPLIALPYTCHWSPDSSLFMTAGCTSDMSYPLYFFYRPQQEEFAFVRVGNPYPLETAFESPGVLCISVRPDQLEAANRGGETEDPQYPQERFKLSAPLRIEIAKLTFLPRSKLQQAEAILDALPSHDVELERDGFFPYHGKGILSTDQVFYGRPMEVFHLEAFAESGDPIASEWLEEIRRKKGDAFSLWDNVQEILGHRKVKR